MNRVRSRLVCITSYDARIFQVCSQLLSSEKTLRGEAQGSCQASQALPNLVVREMQRHQKYLEQRMTRLRREAMRLIADDPELNRRFRLMLTTTGIAETSAWGLARLPAGLQPTTAASFRHPVSEYGVNTGSHFSNSETVKRPGSRGYDFWVAEEWILFGPVEWTAVVKL